MLAVRIILFSRGAGTLHYFFGFDFHILNKDNQLPAFFKNPEFRVSYS